jgi:hypothetical protein
MYPERKKTSKMAEGQTLQKSDGNFSDFFYSIRNEKGGLK